MNKRIKLFVCDDHTLFRDGVKAIFRNDPTVEVVGQAGNGKEAVRRVKQTHPDVVLMDISMPEMNGFEATQRIVQASKGVKVLMLTMYDEDDVIVRCLEAGASGYILKDAPFAQLRCAVQKAFQGGLYLSPAVLNRSAVKEYLKHRLDLQDRHASDKPGAGKKIVRRQSHKREAA